MSRIERLRELAKPTRKENWQGAGRDQANIDRWSERACDNSKLAPRASDGEAKLPDTGKRQTVHSTKAAPRSNAEIDKHMAGKRDLNHEGSDYLKNIRRNG